MLLAALLVPGPPEAEAQFQYIMGAYFNAAPALEAPVVCHVSPGMYILHELYAYWAYYAAKVAAPALLCIHDFYAERAIAVHHVAVYAAYGANKPAPEPLYAEHVLGYYVCYEHEAG